MQGLLLAYVTVVIRVTFLMLYLGVLLSYIVNRRFISRLSPVHRILLSREIMSKTSKFALVYLTPMVIAGISFVILTPALLKSPILIAEGVVTALMITFGAIGLIVAYRFKRGSEVRVFTSSLDYRFRWISVAGEKLSSKNEKIFSSIVVSSILFALISIALGLLVSAVQT